MKDIDCQEMGLQKAAVKRKRMACDIIDAIREGSNMPKKQLFVSIPRIFRIQPMTCFCLGFNRTRDR